MQIEYQGKLPVVDKTAFVADGAYLVGDVRVGAHSSIWYGACLRGDVAPITIGESTSVQDCCVLHGAGGIPVRIGNHVTIGHGAVVHACEVQDGVLIGMNATVLDGAVVQEGAVVAAGCVVTPNSVVEANTLVAGVPAKVVKRLDAASASERVAHAERYAELAKSYAQ